MATSPGTLQPARSSACSTPRASRPFPPKMGMAIALREACVRTTEAERRGPAPIPDNRLMDEKVNDPGSRRTCLAVDAVGVALRPPEGVEALIFDWDGTLADSTGANYLSLLEGIGEHGALLDRIWFEHRTGLSTEEMVAVLAAEHQVDLDPALVTARR